MTGAALALTPIGVVVLIGLVLAGQALIDHLRSRPSVAEMVDQALDSGDALGLAESVGVMSDLDGLPGLDGSHDNLDDVDQFRWVEEVMWLTEMYEADEVPIIPGRLPGEAS